MPKQMVSIRLEEEVRDLLKELSRRSERDFGTRLSQAQIVERAVREYAVNVKEEK